MIIGEEEEKKAINLCMERRHNFVHGEGADTTQPTILSPPTLNQEVIILLVVWYMPPPHAQIYASYPCKK